MIVILLVPGEMVMILGGIDGARKTVDLIMYFKRKFIILYKKYYLHIVLKISYCLM